MNGGVVLDTHALVWYFHEPERLSTTAVQRIENSLAQGFRLVISIISLVEIRYLVERWRLKSDIEVNLWKEVQHTPSLLSVNALDLDTVEAMQQIPRDQVPDMPDHIIAATALGLKLTLISKDEQLHQVPALSVIW